jgi:hypothetical protein
MHCNDSTCLHPTPGINMLLIDLVPMKKNVSLFKIWVMKNFRLSMKFMDK